MQLLLKSIATSLILILGSAAWAHDDSANMCACFCVEGSLQTLCTDMEDAQDGPNECSESEATICPIPTGEASGWRYDAPEAGSTNCRDARVWQNDAFAIVKVCNVLGALDYM